MFKECVYSHFLFDTILRQCGRRRRIQHHKIVFTKFIKKSIKRLKITMLRFVVVIHLESLACHPQ